MPLFAPLARLLPLAALCAIALAGCKRTSEQPSNISPLVGADFVDAGSGPAPQINPDTHLAAGQLAESRGDWNTAAAQYRSALTKRPNDAEALYRLGVVLCRLRDRSAIEIWQRYIDVTRNSAEGWGNLGLCYELLDEPQLAQDAYKKGIARDSKNAACRVNYGMLLAARGEYEAAAQHFTHVLPAAQGWYNIGSVCEKQSRNDDAMAAYRRALDLDPQMIVAQRRLAQLAAQVPQASDPVSSSEGGP